MLIAAAAIDQLLDALPELGLAFPAGQLGWRPGPFHRALASLPVVFPLTPKLQLRIHGHPKSEIDCNSMSLDKQWYDRASQFQPQRRGWLGVLKVVVMGQFSGSTAQWPAAVLSVAEQVAGQRNWCGRR
ncbi:hypothetical protein [Nocardia sp. NBC_00565]|uniref:hypothetical protein n=1 Tax=Nocardia sp. NBC_00565 TaxID=2975993 RepID=UPI002E81029C|nr:hypothetical protein [Nocardia sp. NBC_00565]